jgi:hypothetical protein
MTPLEAAQILIDNGFSTGWVLHDTELVLWEHEQEPPAPFKKPE